MAACHAHVTVDTLRPAGWMQSAKTLSNTLTACSMVGRGLIDSMPCETSEASGRTILLSCPAQMIQGHEQWQNARLHHQGVGVGC